MAKKGKKYQEAASKVDRTQYYSVEEAIKLAKETSVANFDASVEVAFRLGIDTRKNDQQIRGAVVLPHCTVNHNVYSFSLKAIKSLKLKKQVQIM